MNILFLTYGDVSFSDGALRPPAVLRSLADAGHQVDVLARRVDIPPHPHIRILAGAETPSTRSGLRMAAFRAASEKKYTVLHAVDDAALFASILSRLRKIPLVYDASRSFSGPGSTPPSWVWKLFPRSLRKRERKILQRAVAVLSPCSTLSAELKATIPDARIAQIEDIPAQSLHTGRETDSGDLFRDFEGQISAAVVCSVLPDNRNELRKLLVGVRKVVEAIPSAAFFLRGNLMEDARSMAENLDIKNRCVFLEDNDVHRFLSALDVASATLLMPRADNRYIHNDVFTLLNTSAPLVFVQNAAYEDLLSDKNCIPVISSSEAIAEGLLRAVQEPLFSLGIALQGQQLIADRYSLSSFKHKIRMTYHAIPDID